MAVEAFTPAVRAKPETGDTLLVVLPQEETNIVSFRRGIDLAYAESLRHAWLASIKRVVDMPNSAAILKGDDTTMLENALMQEVAGKDGNLVHVIKGTLPARKSLRANEITDEKLDNLPQRTIGVAITTADEQLAHYNSHTLILLNPETRQLQTMRRYVLDTKEDGLVQIKVYSTPLHKEEVLDKYKSELAKVDIERAFKDVKSTPSAQIAYYYGYTEASLIKSLLEEVVNGDARVIGFLPVDSLVPSQELEINRFTVLKPQTDRLATAAD